MLRYNLSCVDIIDDLTLASPGDDPGVIQKEITFLSLLAHAIMVYHAFGEAR